MNKRLSASGRQVAHPPRMIQKPLFIECPTRWGNICFYAEVFGNRGEQCIKPFVARRFGSGYHQTENRVSIIGGCAKKLKHESQFSFGVARSNSAQIDR